ncbi:MAG: hypothetical protein A2138_10995 [Deltaproteobacteria bacterium RBG_16_71_12]|nr:MAG: hypothetical protein A2138_10995 [Deltaproteobacteria bacterium RBG_16_71_12]
MPPGFVICAGPLSQVIGGSDRAAEVTALIARGDDEALHAAQQLVAGLAVTDELRRAVLRACAELGGTAGPFAVRSSAVAEDSVDRSFAGLFVSELGVRGEAELFAAVARCLASALAPRVRAYGRASGLAPDQPPRMAVIVQRLVEADAAGVLFTVDPVRGSDDVSVVEAVPGLGEPLVSGRAAADLYRIDVGSGAVLERAIADKKSALVVDGPRVVERVLDPSAARRSVLSDDEARALVALGQQLQERLGYPLDIEWARTGGRFVLVQARPITAIRFAPDLGEWTTADFRDGGVSADVCTPFLWSLYERAFDVSMLASCVRLKLREPEETVKWSRMFFGRPYWNLGEVKRTLKKVPGYIERELDTDLGVAPSYDGPGDRTPLTLWSALGALPTLFALWRDFDERLRLCRRFRDAFPTRRAHYDRTHEQLRALDDASLAALFHGALALQHETETGYFETIYALTNAKLELKPSFEEAKRRRGGDLEYTALVGGLTDLSHLRPLVDLHALARRLHESGRQASDDDVRAYAQRWPHHARRELDITQPRWDEDHELVRELIDDAVRSFDPARDPLALQRERRREAEAHKERAVSAIGRRPLARRNFVERLERVRAFAWWREEMRDCSTWMYALVRRIALEVGRRLADRGVLADAGDVFLLRAEEAVDAFSGALDADEAKRRIKRGRSVMRGFRNFKNPNEVGARHTVAPRAPRSAGGNLSGIACSSGRAEGKARIATTLDDARALAAGEILVACYTDPGWTPLFARIAAVVTETGGLLSHAAVIAREYGIPAVLAVSDATSILRTGQTVVVDGSAGQVTGR